MSKKPLLINAIQYKCPRCQSGNLFVKPFQWKNPINMPENCDKCGQAFEPEPGFYYGSMFVSYIISAFVFLSVMAVSIMYFGLSLNQSFVILLVFSVITYVFLIRFSRSLWINFLVSYDAKSLDKQDGQ
jgi:uncharacterized protein (DUF983 family)